MNKLILYNDEDDYIIHKDYNITKEEPIIKCSKCQNLMGSRNITIFPIDMFIEGLLENKNLFMCLECEKKIYEKTKETIKDLEDHIKRKEKYLKTLPQ